MALPPRGVLIIGAQGLAADRPPATTLPDNFVWLSTDTEIYSVVAGGAWIDIGSGGGSSLDQQGSGSPVGVVTPTAVGYRYTDTSNGAVYLAVGATNADWISLGGVTAAVTAGVFTDLFSFFLACAQGFAGLTDIAAYAGTGNSLRWDNTGGIDGAQSLGIQLGPAGEFTWQFNADGSMTAPGSFDAASLGPTIPYVTVQTGVPTTYQTPQVYDNTAVTGGLYAWDGAAYQKVGPLA